LFAQLVSKIFNLCGHDPPTSQTDRQTTCDRKTALLHYSASRGKNCPRSTIEDRPTALPHYHVLHARWTQLCRPRPRRAPHASPR